MSYRQDAPGAEQAMDLNEKDRHRKFLIVVIKDGRRLGPSEIANALTILLLIIVLGFCAAAAAGYFIGRQVHDPPGAGRTAEGRLPDRAQPPLQKAPEEKVPVAAVKPDDPQRTAHQVAVEDFEAAVNQKRNAVRIRFALLNVHAGKTPATGYVFVVLQPRQPASEYWPSYPKALLRNGAVQNFEKGDPFSIVKKKIIKVKIEVSSAGDYDSAVIHVYASDGTLILKRIFPVDHAAPG